jgi:hypothetical protein
MNIFFLVFGLGIWVTGQSLKRQGCCVKCGTSDTPGTPVTPETPDSPGTPGTVKKEDEMCKFSQQLKASFLI